MYRIFSLLFPLVLLFAFFTPVHAESLWSVYQLARENDPEFLRAIAGKRAGKEEVEIAQSAYWPKINLTATHGRTESDTTTTHQESYGANLNIPVFDHSLYVASDRANSVYTQTEVQLQTAEQNLIVKVAQRFFDVLSARDNVEFSKAEQQSIARQLDQTKQRFDVGLVAITDVHEAQARYDLAVAQGIRAENELGNALEVLSEVTGEVHQANFKIGEDTPMLRPQPDDIEEWTKLALANNPDLHDKEEAVKLAQHDVKATRSSDWPNIYANITYSHSNDRVHGDTGTIPGYTTYVYGSEQGAINNDPADITGYAYNPPVQALASETTTDSTTGSITLNYNFYDGGSTRAKRRRAQAYLEQAQDNLIQTRRAIQRQSRNAYLNVISGISRINALKQAVVSRESAQKAAEAGFEVGTKTTVDVLDSRRELFSAQNEYAKSRYDFLLDSLRLKQAAGTLREADLKQVGEWLVAAAPVSKSKSK